MNTRMDEDVKLTMEQAQEKWLTKMLLGAAVALATLALGTCAHNDRVDKSAEVQKEQLHMQTAQAEAMKAMWDHQKMPEDTHGGK